VQPWTLVRAFLSAFTLHLPSTQAVVDRYGPELKASARSTLSYALRRASSLEMVKRMWSALETLFRAGEEALVALDSMPVTLPSTRRHGCRPINSYAVGGGVLWAFLINAARGTCPVQILRTIVGPWHDTQVVAQVKLTPRGPVYLMDRGFWSIELIRAWLKAKVRFIVRVTRESFVYHAVRLCGKPRTVARGIRVEFDGVAVLGGQTRKNKPLVRLVIAYLASGEDLILASDRMNWSAERLLEAYRQRWQIERFHFALKECLGLAHLYSFQENGLLFLLQVAVLLATLLLLGEVSTRGLTVDILLAALTNLRATLGVPTTAWRSNTAKPMKKSGGRKRQSCPKNH
jgi:hypothetical protein